MDILSRSQVERRVARDLKVLVKRYGFDKEDDTIHYKNRKQYYDFFPRTGLIVNNGKFYKQELVQKRIHPVESVWDDLKELAGIVDMKNRPSLTITIRYCFPDIDNHPYLGKNFDGIACDATVAGVSQYISIVHPILTEHLLPALEKYNDLREINKVAMESIPFPKRVQGFLGSQGVKFRRLIIARLVGDQRFEELYDHEMQFEAEYLKAAAENPGLSYFSNYPMVLREIYKRLQRLQPLENPVLE